MSRRAVDTARPPFRYRPSDAPHDVAEDIVAAFRAVAELPDKVQWVWRQAARCLGDPDLRAEFADPVASIDCAASIAFADSSAEVAVHAAGEAIAAAIDADRRHFDRHAYHNRQHFCEVMLAVCFLCQMHGLGPVDAMLVLLAALAHDIVYEGQSGQAFESERRSVELATPYFVAAGVGCADRARLTALMLATEPKEGVPIALGAAQFHAHRLALPPTSAAAPELDALAADAGLSRLALVLCEADLLPSVGLTASHGMQLQGRLSEEWSRPLTPSDKLRFVDAVLRQGAIGAFFRPNALALRDVLLDSIDAPARL